MGKKYIIVISIAIILTVVLTYIFFKMDNNNDVLEEVDFSTMKEVDIDAMVEAKERMNASSEAITDQE